MIPPSNRGMPQPPCRYYWGYSRTERPKMADNMCPSSTLHCFLSILVSYYLHEVCRLHIEILRPINNDGRRVLLVDKSASHILTLMQVSCHKHVRKSTPLSSSLILTAVSEVDRCNICHEEQYIHSS